MKRVNIHVNDGNLAAEYRSDTALSTIPAEEKLEAAVRIVSALSCAAVVIASFVLVGVITLLPVSLISMMWIAIKAGE